MSDDPNGHFAEGVFELIDQLESETNGVRTRAGMPENARQGYLNGSRLKPMHTVPPYLYKPETIQLFQARLREALLGGDRATARVYLQNLVDHIVVGEDEIISRHARARPSP